VIDFYESEHKILEDKYKNLKIEHEALLVTERKLRDEISRILDANTYQARTYEPLALNSYSHIHDETIQNLKNENTFLRGKLGEAEAKNVDLKSELSTYHLSRSNQEEEIRRLIKENSQIRSSLKHESQVEINELKYELRRKEDSIKSLELKIMSLKQSLDLAENHKAETARLENKIDYISKERNKEILDSMRLLNLGNQSKQDGGSKPESPFLVMMEFQLKQAVEQKDEISKKLAKAEEQNEILKEKKSILERDLRASEQSKSIYESKATKAESQNETLSSKVKRLEQELLDSSNKIDKLLEEMKLLSREDRNKQLDSRYFDDWRQALMDKMKLEEEVSNLRRQVKANLQDSNGAMIDYLKTELKYTKARMLDIVERFQYLYYKHTYMTRTSDISSRMLKDEIKIFGDCGIYPDYTPKKKPSFAAVAKLVLASVRIKNRYERSQTRKDQIRQLKLELERGKAELNL
jgi:chromosome segregation ATPase